MNSILKYLTKGLVMFLLVDTISAFVMMLIWNSFVAWNSFPTVNFIQCLGVILIYDIFSTVEMSRKSLTEKLDKELKQ